jgi:hypothetical protein
LGADDGRESDEIEAFEHVLAQREEAREQSQPNW